MHPNPSPDKRWQAPCPTLSEGDKVKKFKP